MSRHRQEVDNMFYDLDEPIFQNKSFSYQYMFQQDFSNIQTASVVNM